MASTSPFWARINFRIEEKNRAIINKQKEEEAICKSWNVDIWDAMWEQYKQTLSFKISRCYKQTFGFKMIRKCREKCCENRIKRISQNQGKHMEKCGKMMQITYTIVKVIIKEKSDISELDLEFEW